MPKKQDTPVFVWSMCFNLPEKLQWEDDKNIDHDKIKLFKETLEDFREYWKYEHPSKYIIQLERGAQGTLHFQGYINLDSKIRKSTWIKEINSGPWRGMEISPASKTGKNALKKYAMKRETRVMGPWADTEIYLGEDLPTTLLPWQLKLKKYLLGEINPREIIWINDPAGCGGKSIFAKYMAFHHGAVKLTFGDAGNLLNLVSKRRGKRIYIFDLTRVKPQKIAMDDMYSAMEDIKNGHFVNLKYETEEILMNPPHIVVFSNQAPDQSGLTDDRWTIMDMPENANPFGKKKKRKKFSW